MPVLPIQPYDSRNSHSTDQHLRNLLLVINDQYPGMTLFLHLFSPEIDTTAQVLGLNSILSGHLGGLRETS
jgi:hypothetical protein